MSICSGRREDIDVRQEKLLDPTKLFDMFPYRKVKIQDGGNELGEHLRNIAGNRTQHFVHLSENKFSSRDSTAKDA